MPTAELPFMQHNLHDQYAVMSVVNPNQRQQLRRAVYVHVSDLTSTYNIDHAKLEQELARVKEESGEPDEEPKSRSNSLGSVPRELDTSYPKKRLSPPRGGYNMVALVGKVRVVVDKNRVDGSRVRLAEVEVGDETGIVSLRARDEQIDTLEHISEHSGAVVLRNCTLELYQGKHIRVAVSKWGKLTPYPDQVPSTPPPPSKINRDRNFSMINLSLVANEMAAQPSHQQQTDPHGESESASLQGSLVSGRGFQPRQLAGGRGRRPTRGKVSTSTNMPQRSYPDSTMRAPYPGGSLPHGYAGAGFVDSIGYYPPTQQEGRMASPQHQQQMMLQHQFELQQRQMQQMYHGGASQDSQHQRPLQPVSPMLIPGVPSATSFESYSPGSEGVPIPMVGSSQSMMPIPSPAAPPSPHLQPDSSRSQSPLSPGKMNPQAATFDPSAKLLTRPSS